MVKYFFILSVLFLSFSSAYAQQRDSSITKKDTITKPLVLHDSAAIKDSILKKKHDPHKASLYSAILPGAGQVYNRKYWKLPLVYAGVGIPAYTYFYNKGWYNKTRYALAVVVNGSTGNADSLNKVDPKLRPLVDAGSINSLKNYRDEFRKDQDYSVLFVLLFWGLNIVDATVDAHLRDFDVSSDLSLRIKPVIIPEFNVVGLNFAFDIHKPKPRLIDLTN